MWRDLEEEQNRLFQFFRMYLTSIPIIYSSHSLSLFAAQPEFITFINHVRKIVRKKCQRCQSVFCTACGERISADRTHRPGVATDDNELFHCSNLQGVILGVGLAIVEQQFVEDAVGEIESSERTTKRRKMSPISQDSSPSPLPFIQSRGKKAKGGTGYAGDWKEDVSLSFPPFVSTFLIIIFENSGQLEALAAQKAKDEKIGNLLIAVREYLPYLHREGGGQTSDYLVHPTALAHLRRRFNFICSTLLKNDSLADMSERSVLYFELLEWLEVS